MKKKINQPQKLEVANNSTPPSPHTHLNETLASIQNLKVKGGKETSLNKSRIKSPTHESMSKKRKPKNKRKHTKEN